MERHGSHSHCDCDQKWSSIGPMAFASLTTRVGQLPLPVVLSSAVILLSLLFFGMLFGKKWDPKGQHCYVTGGSQGTGFCLALSLVKQCAHVSIVARDVNKLKTAIEKLEEVRQHPNQIIKWYSESLSTYEGAAAALKQACQPFDGKVPDAIFNCAGSSRPAYFIEETAETIKAGMDNAYWVQAYTALVRLFNDNCVKVDGYSSYAPGKFALRGLAEGLRNEFQLYGISIHIYHPSTIYSPGYIEENKTKPPVTLKIEESDSGMTPEQAAKGILECVQGGKFHHESDWITKIFRAGTRGSAPSGPLDFFGDIASWIVVPIVRFIADSEVSKHRTKHEEYLRSKGFYDSD